MKLDAKTISQRPDDAECGAVVELAGRLESLRLPLRQRVIDELITLLVTVDALLIALDDDTSGRFARVETRARDVRDEVSSVLSQLTN